MADQKSLYNGDAGLVGVVNLKEYSMPHITATMFGQGPSRIDRQLDHKGYPKSSQDTGGEIYVRQDTVRRTSNEYPIMQNTPKPWRLPTLREAFKLIYLAEITRRTMGDEAFAKSPLKAFGSHTRYWTQPEMDEGKIVPVIAYAGMNPETFGFEVDVMKGDEAAEKPAGQMFVLDDILM